MLAPCGSEPTTVDVLTGCFWLLRRDAIEPIGGLDEQFFMYGEDLDLCKRLRDGHWQIVYAPAARIIHHGGASSGDAPLRFLIELHRAQLQYWRKHHCMIVSALYFGTLSLHNILRLIGYWLISIARRNRHIGVYRMKMERSWACLNWLMSEGVSYLTPSRP